MSGLISKPSITDTLRAMVVGQSVEIKKVDVIASDARVAAARLKRLHNGEVEYVVSDKDARNTSSYTIARIK